MFFFDCAGERVLNEIVRPNLIPGQGTSIAAQARDFLLETAMEVVHLFLFLELSLWKQGDEKRPSEPKQIRMRSAASYVGPESSSSLAIAGGPCIDDCQYSRQAVLPSVGITGSSATPAHLRVHPQHARGPKKIGFAIDSALEEAVTSEPGSLNPNSLVTGKNTGK